METLVKSFGSERHPFVVPKGMGANDETVPEEFVRSVNLALVDKGWSRRDLAKAIEQVPSTVTKLLKVKKVGRQTVQKVASVLGLADPYAPLEHTAVQWAAIGEFMRVHDPARYAAFLEMMLRWRDGMVAMERAASILTSPGTPSDRQAP